MFVANGTGLVWGASLRAGCLAKRCVEGVRIAGSLCGPRLVRSSVLLLGVLAWALSPRVRGAEDELPGPVQEGWQRGFPEAVILGSEPKGARFEIRGSDTLNKQFRAVFERDGTLWELKKIRVAWERLPEPVRAGLEAWAPEARFESAAMERSSTRSGKTAGGPRSRTSWPLSSTRLPAADWST